LDAKLCCWTKILREELIRIKIVAALAVSSKNRWLDKDSIALKFRERLFAKLIFYRHEKSASTTYVHMYKWRIWSQSYDRELQRHSVVTKFTTPRVA
jgi:hypothetical protein